MDYTNLYLSALGQHICESANDLTTISSPNEQKDDILNDILKHTDELFKCLKQLEPYYQQNQSVLQFINYIPQWKSNFLTTIGEKHRDNPPEEIFKSEKPIRTINSKQNQQQVKTWHSGSQDNRT